MAKKPCPRLRESGIKGRQCGNHATYRRDFCRSRDRRRHSPTWKTESARSTRKMDPVSGSPLLYYERGQWERTFPNNSGLKFRWKYEEVEQRDLVSTLSTYHVSYLKANTRLWERGILHCHIKIRACRVGSRIPILVLSRSLLSPTLPFYRLCARRVFPLGRQKLRLKNLSNHSLKILFS